MKPWRNILGGLVCGLPTAITGFVTGSVPLTLGVMAVAAFCYAAGMLMGATT